MAEKITYRAARMLSSVNYEYEESFESFLPGCLPRLGDNFDAMS